MGHIFTVGEPSGFGGGEILGEIYARVTLIERPQFHDAQHLTHVPPVYKGRPGKKPRVRDFNLERFCFKVFQR